MLEDSAFSVSGADSVTVAMPFPAFPVTSPAIGSALGLEEAAIDFGPAFDHDGIGADIGLDLRGRAQGERGVSAPAKLARWRAARPTRWALRAR